MSTTFQPMASAEPTRTANSPWLWTARLSALLYTFFFAGEYVATARPFPLSALTAFLLMFGVRILLGLVLLYFLFRGARKSLAFALGLGVATAFLALFGVAANAWFSPLGRTFPLFLALIVFTPTTPPFTAMMRGVYPGLAREGLWLFWSFGLCAAVLGFSSIVAFRKMALDGNESKGLRFAFRAGIGLPFAVWLLLMLLILIALVANGGIHV